MKFHIEKVILWSADGRCHCYDFEPGRLNVISGARQTGRTSFVNIIDYVLGSPQCHLPSIFAAHVETLGVVAATAKRRYLLAREVPQRKNARGEKCAVETYNANEAVRIDMPPELTLRINDLRRQLDEIVCPPAKPGEKGESAPPTFREVFNFCQQDDLTIIRRDCLVRGFESNGLASSDRMREILPFIFSVHDKKHMELRERILALEAEGEEKKAARERTTQHLRVVLEELARCVREAQEIGLYPAEEKVPEHFNSDLLVAAARRILEENKGAVVPQPQQKPMAEKQVSANDLQTKQEDCSRQIAKLQSDIAALEALDKKLKEYMGDSGQLRDRLEVSEWVFDFFSERFKFNIEKTTDPDKAVAELETLRAALKDFNETACNDEARDNYRIAYAGELERKRKQLDKKFKELSGYSAELKRLVGEDEEVRDFVASPRKAYALLGKIENAVFTWDNLAGAALSLDELQKISSEKAQCEQRLKEMERAEADRERQCESNISARIRDHLRSLFVSRGFKDATSIFDLKTLSLSFMTTNGTVPSSNAGASSNYVCFHVAVSAAIMEHFSKTPDTPVPNFVLFDCPAQENGLDENGEELHYVEQLEGTLIEALNDSAGDKWQPILILQSNTQPFEESEHTHIVAHFNEAEGIIPKEWIE